MNIETFKKLKNSPDALILTNEMAMLISMLSVGSRKSRSNVRGGNQLLKNPKMQLLKDKVENKVNLVLNKLSEININNLAQEFIESMSKINHNEYLEVQKAFYVKMQADISFINVYLEFFKIISNVYKEVFNFNSDIFYSLIETKFLMDYKNMKPDESYLFLKDYEEESKRINNLIMIRTMINIGMFTPAFQEVVDNMLLEQNYHFADIYYWFQNEKLTTEIKNKIKSKITNNSLPLREKVLLDNLIDNKEKKPIDFNKLTVSSESSPRTPAPQTNFINKSKVKNIISTDTLKLETENILEEYLNLNSLDDMKEFIEDRCKDALTKNKFCQYVFDKYFELSMDSSVKILDMLKLLVKKQILYKSNLSRGVLLIYTNWADVSLDYNNPNKKMKDLLTCLKNMGITKYLETLLKTYKIEYEQ